METTIGCSNTLGMSDKETMRLNNIAIGGMYFSNFREINPSRGIAKAKPKGTAIRSTGFTIFVPLSYED
jgi:hypothetical protein